MAEPKFTPGPWEVSGRSHNGGMIVCPESHAKRPVGAAVDKIACAAKFMHQIAAVSLHPCWFALEESKANMDLIAAAPEMYEALRDVEWAIDGFCPQCGRSREVGHQEKCALAKALAKARGEAK